MTPDHVCLSERQSAALHRLRRGDCSSGGPSHAADGHRGKEGEENLMDPGYVECLISHACSSVQLHETKRRFGKLSLTVCENDGFSSDLQLFC